MATYLLITKGPKKGERFQIVGGEKIGREKGDIVLGDLKVSSLHAVVKKTLLGNLILSDHKSKNGIFIEDQRVYKIKLTDGVEFRIGENIFLVQVLDEGTISNATADISTVNSEKSISKGDINTSELANFEDFSVISDLEPPEEDGSLAYDPEQAEDVEKEESLFTIVSPKENNLEYDNKKSISISLTDLTSKSPKNKPAISIRTLETRPRSLTNAETEAEERRTWSQILVRFSRQQLKNTNDHPKEVVALSPRVKLTFFRGPQAETEWELGYGPRTAGKNSLDLPIHEQGVQHKNCFEIRQSDDGPILKTEYPSEVLVNGKSLPQVTLKTGDIISIHETEIEVDLF